MYTKKKDLCEWVNEASFIKHFECLLFPMFFSVNDIVAVGVESFYATNDRYFHSNALLLIAVYLDLTWCDVVFYSPHEVRVVADGLRSPNGINISPDKRFISVRYTNQ